jgi:hypothetical protein
MHENEASDDFFIFLDNPPHLFHGNHWFHFGEHFLSRRNELVDSFSTNLAFSNENNNKRLFILSNNNKLLDMMTSFTFFLLVLTCWMPQFQTISVMKLQKSSFLSRFGESVPEADYGWSPGQRNDIVVHPAIFHYDRDKPVNVKFVRYPEVLTSEVKLSAVYVGSVGDYPITSDSWFKSAEDVKDLKFRMGYLCGGADGFVDNDRNKSFKKRVVLYQRDQTRKISNFNELMERLKTIFEDEWDVIPVYHSETRNPCLLYEIMKTADAFVSLHGFQFSCKSIPLFSNALL